MQAHDSDSDSEGGVGGVGQPPANNIAAVHALNEMRTAALRDIDEGGFSCVATLSPSSACLPAYRAFKAGFISNYALSPALGFSRMREWSLVLCLMCLSHLENGGFFFLILPSRLGMISSRST
jgi:hypothetical protein